MARLWCPGMAIQMLSYKAADKGIRCDVSTMMIRIAP